MIVRSEKIAAIPYVILALLHEHYTVHVYNVTLIITLLLLTLLIKLSFYVTNNNVHSS